MKTRSRQNSAIDDYHRLEIEELFTRTREHRNQRAQIYSLLGTGHVFALGLAFNNQTIGIMMLAIALPVALIIIDNTLKRALAAVELRGLQLENLYAPDPKTALMHVSIAASPWSSKRISDLTAIDKIKDPEKQMIALRKTGTGFTSSIALPLLVIIEIGMTISLWLSGWGLF